MERRKVQRVGGGTFTVSLPKTWAERAGLDAGETVHVDARLDDTLVVVPEPAEDDATARVCLRVTDESPARIERSLRAAYLAGFEELVIETPDGLARPQRRTVDRVVRSFVGVGIAREATDRLVIRAMLDPEEVSVRQSLRQLRSTALSMHRDATAAIIDGEPTRITDRDDDADRLFAMIDRHFGRGLSRLDEVDALGCSRSELFEFRTAARELERVADHAQRIASVAETLDAPPAVPSDRLAAVAADTRDVVTHAVSVLVDDEDADVAHSALETRTAVAAAVDDLRDHPDTAVGPQLARVLDSIDRTAAHGGNLAELALRSAVRRRDATAEGVASPIEKE